MILTKDKVLHRSMAHRQYIDPGTLILIHL